MAQFSLTKRDFPSPELKRNRVMPAFFQRKRVYPNEREARAAVRAHTTKEPIAAKVHLRPKTNAAARLQRGVTTNFQMRFCERKHAAAKPSASAALQKSFAFSFSS
jgi:hypothetical protein